MKKIILTLIFVIGLVGFAAAQSAQKITLRDGQTKNVIGSKYDVKFVSVLEDSRCPAGAVCVWAGNAKVKIQIGKKGDEGQELELNTNLKPQTVEYKGYTIRIISLSPRPGENVKAMAAKHSAIFEITRIKH